MRARTHTHIALALQSYTRPAHDPFKNSFKWSFNTQFKMKTCQMFILMRLTGCVFVLPAGNVFFSPLSNRHPGWLHPSASPCALRGWHTSRDAHVLFFCFCFHELPVDEFIENTAINWDTVGLWNSRNTLVQQWCGVRHRAYTWDFLPTHLKLPLIRFHLSRFAKRKRQFETDRRRNRNTILSVKDWNCAAESNFNL